METDKGGFNARGIPTPICPACGCEWIVVPVKFSQESYEVGMWATNGHCFECRTPVTACTPIDLYTNSEGEM